MWYTWNTYDGYNNWHVTICDMLEIPHPNFNMATGEIDIEAQWTTSYTDVVQVAADDWRAFVEDDVALLAPALLGAPSDAPPAPEVDY